HTSQAATVGMIDVRYRIDVETLHRDESASTLALNDLGRVQVELSAPLVYDSYRRNRATGSLILIDAASNETVAAGVILDTEVEEEADSAAGGRSPNVVWQGSRVTRERRWSTLGQQGATVWFTGLPGAGKSTIAAAVELPFIEIFVDAPLELCEERDPKGLYARARAGELAGLTGVGAPYEAPAKADLVLRTCDQRIDACAASVLELLAERGLLRGR